MQIIVVYRPKGNLCFRHNWKIIDLEKERFRDRCLNRRKKESELARDNVIVERSKDIETGFGLEKKTDNMLVDRDT